MLRLLRSRLKKQAPAAPAAGGAAHWLPTTIEAYAEILAAIAGAQASIRFEFYIYRPGEPGDRFRAALLAAAQRGVRVRVLLDAIGAGELPADYWRPLRAAGGEAAVFNPVSLARFSVRNHRKLVVVDERLAFLGGFNIAPEYEGDGIARGWRDLGLAVAGPAVKLLGLTFDVMWEHHAFRHRRLFRGRRGRRWRRHLRACRQTEVLPTGPGLGRNPFRRELLRSLRHGRDVRIISSYFVPGLRLRRALARVARRGGRVRLILAGKSDVTLSQAASRSFYRRLLASGVEIAEYQPQILHAKLALVDEVAFAGSSNLDSRSLGLNYEIMLRLAQPEFVRAGRAIFEADWARSRPIRRGEWNRTRSWADRLYGRFARFVLTKFDPWFTRHQLRNLT